MDQLDELRAARIEQKQAELAFLQAARGLARERMGPHVLEKTCQYFDETFRALIRAENIEKTKANDRDNA